MTIRLPPAAVTLVASLIIMPPAIVFGAAEVQASAGAQAEGPATVPQSQPLQAETPRPETRMNREMRELDSRLTVELQALDPEAARLFRQAIEARDRQDHPAASALYQEIHDRVPSFDSALRRQCHEELVLGHRATGVALCRKALQQKESTDNLAALAIALATGTKDSPIRPADRTEAWIGLLGVLLAAGLVLSRLALRAARRVPSAPEGAVTGMDTRLRRIYRGILWLCCGYYYISIPIVILLVLAAGGGAIYAFFWFGQIPIKLVIIIALFTLYTLAAIVRSLFVRRVDEDPGERLDLDRHPRVRSVLDEVAQRVGTRPVDNVYMTPGAQVAVMERGRSLLARARGRAERCLILGAAALDGMRLGPLKAILAHEYGHFSNRDTAGGGFALAVRRSLLTMGQGIARSGAARWYNPAWLFVNGFYRVFLRISQGASRLQEVLADRWAALAFGSRAFEEGLRHIVARSVRFVVHTDATLNEVIKAKQPLQNLYAFQPARPTAEGDIETRVQSALEAKPSPYDSHPASAERIAWVRALAVSGSGTSIGDGEEAWSLFPDREEIERAMTNVVRRNVRRAHGIEIAGDTRPGPDPVPRAAPAAPPSTGT